MRRLLTILALWPAVALADPVLDSGLPVSTTIANAAPATKTLTVSTQGPDRLVTVEIWHVWGTAVTWTVSGSTLGNFGAAKTGGNGGASQGAFIFTAWASSQLTSEVITLTPSTTSTTGTALLVARAYSSAQSTLGATNSTTTGSIPQVGLTGTAASSAIVFIAGDDQDSGALTAIAGSTIGVTHYDSGWGSGGIDGNATSGGSVTVGSSTTKSVIAAAAIEIVAGSSAAASPTASPNPQTYTTPQTVTLSCASPSPTIRCTTDGTIPTGASPVCTTISLGYPGANIQAICQSSGLTDSPVAGFYFPIGTPFRKLR